MNKTGPQAVYLFCFARSSLLTGIEGNGVDGASPLFLLPFQDVVAVVSVISAEESLGYSTEDRMHDLAWVGPRVCRHEEVIERVMRSSPVLPVGLGTIFASIESVENRLKEHHHSVAVFLEHVSDKDEWAVKGLLNRAAAEETHFNRLLSTQKERLSPSPGTRYLQEQRLRAAAVTALNRSLQQITLNLADDLGRTAADTRTRKVLHREAGEDDRDMITNWAFLVARDSIEDFRTRIDGANRQWAADGLSFEVSGPWPPYSFCPSL